MKNGLLDVRSAQICIVINEQYISAPVQPDNGHRCSLTKTAANKDQITALAREQGDDRQVCKEPEAASGKCLMRNGERR